MCTITETADGATATVTATVSGSGGEVTVPPGKVVPVNLMDVYEGAPGSLKVTKTIAGPAARQHGRIAILVACGGPLHAYAFDIRAHVTGSVSRHFNGIPAGSRCTVSETANGHTQGSRGREQEPQGQDTRQRQSHGSSDRHLQAQAQASSAAEAGGHRVKPCTSKSGESPAPVSRYLNARSPPSVSTQKSSPIANGAFHASDSAYRWRRHVCAVEAACLTPFNRSNSESSGELTAVSTRALCARVLDTP